MVISQLTITIPANTRGCWHSDGAVNDERFARVTRCIYQPLILEVRCFVNDFAFFFIGARIDNFYAPAGNSETISDLLCFFR